MGAPSAAPGAPTALVVEDDHDLGPCIHEILDEVGYTTTLVRSVAEARSALARHGFDVLVLDVMIGPDHARELLQHIVRNGAAPPTLLVSAARDAAILAEQYGIPLVAKPFDLDAFVEQVARVRRDGATPSPPAV